jgi:hypothetical protein
MVTYEGVTVEKIAVGSAVSVQYIIIGALESMHIAP